MKKCFCDSCEKCEPLPNNCRFKKSNVFDLIEYAERTKKEMDNSLKVFMEVV